MTQTTLFSCGKRYRVTFMATDGVKSMIEVRAMGEQHARALAEAERGPAGGIDRFLSVVEVR